MKLSHKLNKKITESLKTNINIFFQNANQKQQIILLKLARFGSNKKRKYWRYGLSHSDFGYIQFGCHPKSALYKKITESNYNWSKFPDITVDLSKTTLTEWINI